jgi:LysM repeat protein
MNRNRFSRSLVGLLVLTLVAGAGLYVRGVLQARPASAKAVIASATSTPSSSAITNATPSAPAPISPSPIAPSPIHPSPIPPDPITPDPITPDPVSPSPISPTPVRPSPNPPDPGQRTAIDPSIASTALLASAQTSHTTQPGTNSGAALAAWSPTAAMVPPAPPSNFLTEAAAKTSTGDLLGARKMLNDALLSGQLSPSDTAATKKAIADINDTLIFGPRKFPDDEYGGVYPVKPGENMKKIAESCDLTWQFLAKINNLSDPRKMRSGVSLKIVKGPFNVVVNKKAFTMDIYLGSTPGQPGSMYVKSYPVGLGREDSTPTGTWLVEMHHKIMNPTYYSPRGEGVIDSSDPQNPLGHRWIGLTGVDGHAVGAQSYGIHGTIDPDSIGKQASMGCIRMHNEDVEVVFDLLAEGKSMVIVKD